MRSLALVAALAACGGSSPPPAQTANTAPVASAEPKPSSPPPDQYGGDPYGGGMYGGVVGGDGYGGYDNYQYTPPPHRTDAEWAALLAKPIPKQYPNCTAYRDAFAKLYKCDKMPTESKDSMYQAYEAFVAIFDQANMPAESVVAMNDACKQGADALVQATSSMGCSP
jgi:hypothetical protein